MRVFIKLCAGLFVVAGALVVLASVLLGVSAVALGRSTPEVAGTAGIVVIAIGLASGASIVLVGGATYLLASIDRRLELAGRGSGAFVPKPQVAEPAAA